MTRVRCSTVATHVTSLPAYPPSAQISASPGKRVTRVLSTSLAPSRSWLPAACTITTRSSPRTSTTMGRVRPRIRLPPSEPRPPLFGGLDRLTLDDPRTGLPRAARGLAQVSTQGIVHPLPDTCTSPRPAIMGDGLVGWKLLREHA